MFSDRATSAVQNHATSDEAFVYHLLAVHQAKRTGVMTVRADAVITDIYLRAGTPVFAECNTMASSLGRVLLSEGLLTEEQYETVIAQMTQELFESEQMRFAEVAIALGFLTHEQVNVRLERQVRTAVAACMAHTRANVSFSQTDAAVVPGAVYPCPVQPLVMAGVKQYYDLARTEAVWRPDARAFAELCSQAPDVAALYALSPNERRYLGNIDGSRRIEELIYTGYLDVLHASQIVVALLLSDGLRLFLDKPAPARLPSLPVPRSFESDSVRRRMSSPFIAAVKVPLPAAEVRAATSVPKEAAPPAKPATEEARPPPAELPAKPPPPAAQKLDAEQLFLRGKRALQAGNLQGALRSLSAAVRLNGDSPEYALYEHWARFLLEPPKQVESALSDLEMLARRTIGQDRTNGFAFYVNGRVAQVRGNLETARQSLKAAVRFDPSNVDAKRFLRAVTKK